nr:CoA transferase [Actinomadura madurae]
MERRARDEPARRRRSLLRRLPDAGRGAHGRRRAGAAVFAAFVRLLGVDVDPADQADRGRWGDMRAAFAAAFATRTRREWTEVFAGSDACVAPVLSLREAAGHPHLAERRCLVEVDGVLQSMPAPRFSRHPRTAPDPAPAVGQHTAEVIPAGAAHQIGTGLSPRG